MACATCEKRETCRELCDEIKALLKNSKENNGLYADTTEQTTNYQFDPMIMDKILYLSPALSLEESRRVREVVITILSPEQKRVLTMFANGWSQEQIAREC